jgi:predicted DNA-binding transcriptional regulator AlpA
MASDGAASAFLDRPAGGAVTGREERAVWDAAEVCAYLGISIETLYHWRSRGYGPPARRVGGRLRYLAREVKTWFESLDPEDS